jgi:hypothetical protein
MKQLHAQSSLGPGEPPQPAVTSDAAGENGRIHGGEFVAAATILRQAPADDTGLGERIE